MTVQFFLQATVRFTLTALTTAVILATTGGDHGGHTSGLGTGSLEDSDFLGDLPKDPILNLSRPTGRYCSNSGTRRESNRALRPIPQRTAVRVPSPRRGRGPPVAPRKR